MADGGEKKKEEEDMNFEQGFCLEVGVSRVYALRKKIGSHI